MSDCPRHTGAPCGYDRAAMACPELDCAAHQRAAEEDDAATRQAHCIGCGLALAVTWDDLGDELCNPCAAAMLAPVAAG